MFDIKTHAPPETAMRHVCEQICACVTTPTTTTTSTDVKIVARDTVAPREPTKRDNITTKNIDPWGVGGVVFSAIINPNQATYSSAHSLTDHILQQYLHNDRQITNTKNASMINEVDLCVGRIRSGIRLKNAYLGDFWYN